MKKPSPCSARSEGFELIAIVPCVKSGRIACTCVPRPIWRGFVPPLPSVGAEPRPSVCRNCVENNASDFLKPTVLEFATLLPATSIIVSLACKPVTAVLNTEDKPMIQPLYRSTKLRLGEVAMLLEHRRKVTTSGRECLREPARCS